MSKRYTAACYRPELPVVPEFSARPLPFHCPLFACTLTPHCEPPLPSRPDRTQQQQTAANSNNNNYNHNNYNHNNHRIGAVFFGFFFFWKKLYWISFSRAVHLFLSLISSDSFFSSSSSTFSSCAAAAAASFCRGIISISWFILIK